MTDNSYKLFASPPTPGTDMRRISVQEPVPSKSTTDLDTPTRDAVVDEESSRKSEGSSQEKDKKPEVIKGPWRLLRLLPRETRHIMSRMLEIDPRKRAKMVEIIEDLWVAGSEPNVCRQEEGTHGAPGKVILATNHQNTLEGPSPLPSEKK